MSYEWTRGESIDAWKLNLTGKQRQMFVPNQTGLDGGITNASITPADMESSSPYTTGPLYGQQEHEKWIGAGTLFYDYGSNTYKVMTGPANVSGVISLIDTNVSVCAKSYTVDPQWVAGGGRSMYDYLAEYQEWDQGSDNTCPPPIWCWQADTISGYSSSYVDGPLIVQDIVNVNPWGFGMNHSQAILPAYVNGWTIPTPPSKGYCDIGSVAGNNGTYQRSSAIIRAVCNCDGSRSLELVNSSDNVIWPVVRPMGFEKESILDTERFVQDRKNRWAKTHWSPIVSRKQVSNPIIPSYSIGEGGGVFVDRITDKGTDAWSLSIASGIEWYTCNTMPERNLDDPRPHGTGASVNLGRWGYITISAINPEHPWQFLLDADLDLGSWDPGSHGWDPGTIDPQYLPVAHGILCNGTYYNWMTGGGAPQPWPPNRGIMDGTVQRVLASSSAKTTYGNYASAVQFRVGEIRNGALGISTARWIWGGDYGSDDPTGGCVFFAQSGGVVVGIAPDSPCRPYIDCGGMIHTPNREWTTQNLVGTANSTMYAWDVSQFFEQRPIKKIDSYRCLETSGKVSGRV